MPLPWLAGMSSRAYEALLASWKWPPAIPGQDSGRDSPHRVRARGGRQQQVRDLGLDLALA